MPWLDEITYSRDATINAVREYYRFLVATYLPSSYIIEPPLTGWPSITADSFRAFGKSDEVIGLLRHLPYIHEPSDDKYKAEGAPNCFFADYSSDRIHTPLGMGRGEDVKILTEGLAYESVPAHVLGLTKGGRDNPVFLLDTKLGIVYWLDCPNGPKHAPSREKVWDDAEEYAPEEEQEWRGDAPAWTISDFFQVLKDEFIALNFVPVSPRAVFDKYSDWSGQEGLLPRVQEIYRAHGWPNLETYQKDRCLEAVKGVLQEYHLDFIV
ncbi:hypothetical protein F4779DRAFT_612010 [Xylariaceae sp. FL0662B]|nr:hypothetical protein F4779DRAFT_612010 [Xylariaceae sp. FL0662B]